MMRRLITLAAALLLAAACADNATSLRSKIAGAMTSMESESGDVTKTFTYSPTTKPYTIIFFPERRVFGAEEMMGLQEEPHKAYAEQIPRLLQELCAHFDHDRINLLAAHLFVSGARPGGGFTQIIDLPRHALIRVTCASPAPAAHGPASRSPPPLRRLPHWMARPRNPRLRA